MLIIIFDQQHCTMGKIVTRPHSAKLGFKKGSFKAPLGKQTNNLTIVKIKLKNLGKAHFSEIYIGSNGLMRHYKVSGGRSSLNQ